MLVRGVAGAVVEEACSTRLEMVVVVVEGR